MEEKTMAKIKKLLALGLCLCMAAGITVGCGNSKSSKNGTFGAASKASAPGQVGVHELKKVLDIIHSSL